MHYKINEIEFDSNEVIEYLTALDLLHVCKSIVEKTGCSLTLARDYYYQMLNDNGIEEPEHIKELRNYLMSEYEEE